MGLPHRFLQDILPGYLESPVFTPILKIPEIGQDWGKGTFCVFFFPLENRTPLFPEDTTVSQLPSIRCLPFTGRRQGLRGMGSPSPSGLDLKPCLLLPSHSLPPLGPATICSPEGEFSPRPEVCLVIHCQTAKWRY